MLAVLVFAVCRWVLPFFLGLVGGAGSGDAGQMIGTSLGILSNLAMQFAPFAALFVLAVWIVAQMKKRLDRARLDRQSGPASIAALSWHEFESLLAEAFRRQGFAVEHTGGASPARADGGVDLRLSKAGAVMLVQCKHWTARRVGVGIVRELRGVVASEGAHAGIVVTSGGYTADAIAFAATNPIRLIDGPELGAMIAEVRKPARARGSHAASHSSTAVAAPTGPSCPTCGAAMVERIARTGKNAGSAFFGCSQFPKCRGKRALGNGGA